MKKNSKEWKALQKKWEKKLKDSGFVDIESGEYSLKDYHSKRFVSDPTTFAEKQRYYELASQMLHHFPFVSKQAKAIWKLHSAGFSDHEISKRLKYPYEAVQKAVKTLAAHITNV